MDFFSIKGGGRGNHTDLSFFKVDKFCPSLRNNRCYFQWSNQFDLLANTFLDIQLIFHIPWH